MQVPSSTPTPQVLLLGTGGTIAGAGSADGHPLAYVAGQIGVDQLVAGVPGLAQALAGRTLVTEQLAQLDSKDMDHATWQALARRVSQGLGDPAVQAIVITHGTDTIEETAWWLAQVLAPVKPVVLTCAMRPATAPEPDGPGNLRDALAWSAHPAAGGVSLVAAGQAHAAGPVSKFHPQSVHTFSSGEHALRGQCDAALVWQAPAAQAASPDWPQAPAGALAAVLATPVADWPRVPIWFSHAGADARALQALLHSGIDGLVLACTGNGTLHQDLAEVLLARHDLPVRRASRCPLGRVISVEASPWPDSAGLNPVKARVQLLLEILVARAAPTA